MKYLICNIIIAELLLLPMAPVLAQVVVPEFNPSIIVPDSAFSDTQTFGGPEGIQKFLESKNSVLANTDPSFIAKLSEPSDSALKAALSDPHPELGRLRTASELIWDAAQASGLNPQIILVTLNKEQGLVANQFNADRLQKALNHAMGFDCPDSTGCGNLFPGFYYQLFGNVDTEGNRYLGAAKSLMKSFTTPGGRGPRKGSAEAKVGDSVELANSVGDYDGIADSQTVSIGNAATAALYRYTPHVFNGNYNFWKFFTSWFKYPNGTLLKTLQSDVVYIIQNGSRLQVPSFVATARKLNFGTAVTASPTELQDYPPGPVYGPNDDTIVSANGRSFVFIDSIMHPVTDFVLKQRKLDPASSLPLTSADAGLFTPGSQLTPSDGTVLRGQTLADIYLVEKGVLKLYSPLTFKQYKVAKKTQTIPDSEIELYPKRGYVAPLSGTLIKGTSAPDNYVMADGLRRPLTSELFKNLRYRTKDVVTLSNSAELASIPLGSPATPREGTYFSIGGSKELYIFKEGTKHPIFPIVAKQRGITPDFSFEASIVSGWQDGIAVPPRDGTVLKSDASPTKYLVAKGQLRELNSELFKNLGLGQKKVITFPDNQVGAFAKSGFAMPKENSYFTVAGTNEIYLFQHGTKRRIYTLVAKQRGITSDYTFSAEAANDWPVGKPVAPTNGTLLQSEIGSGVYLISQGKLKIITDADFKRRGYKIKNIKIVSKTELNEFLK